MPDRKPSLPSQADAARVVGEICAAFRIDSLGSRIESLRDARKDDGIVDVAVLGQFKSGKSSFLNSLVGVDLLPVDVLPATSVVTRIAYGPTEGMTVHRLASEPEDVPLARIAEFVTEPLNPGNAMGVSLVEVRVPSLSAWPGIRFVDTPGLNSIFSHNTRTSMEWLPRAGAAILAIGADRPFSEQDLALLTEALRHTPEIAVLLTKADLVTGAQLDAITDFTRRQIARRTGREPRIFPYSVLPSFEASRREVSGYLRDDISARHAEKYGEIVAHKTRTLIRDCADYLRLAERAAAAALLSREALREALRRERADLDAVKREMGLFSRDLVSRARAEAGDRFRAHAAATDARLREALGSRLGEFRGNLAAMAREFREWLILSLEGELASLSARGGDYLSGHLARARSGILRSVRAFQDRLAGEIRDALGLSFSGARFDAAIREPARPDVKVGYVFDIHVEELWFLVPMRIFGGAIRRILLGRIPWEVEKNLSRLAGQWADAFAVSVDGLAGQALRFIEEELATVDRLVSCREDRRPDIGRALRELSALEGGSPPGRLPPPVAAGEVRPPGES